MLMRLPNPGAFAMRPVLPSETRALLPGDLARAREIAAKVTALVEDRDSYVARHDIDPGFAYPQANWGDGAKNAFRGLFDRVRRCDDEAIGQFRAFCQPFTGFRLYEMTIAGEPPDDLSGYTDARIALNLERNLPYVDQWLSLPRHHVFVPPRRFGEIGHDIDGVIVNYDTWAYQERIDLLHDSGALDRLSPTARVLEIGGGYGALGYWFKQAYPGCAYAIVPAAARIRARDPLRSAADARRLPGAVRFQRAAPGLRDDLGADAADRRRAGDDRGL